METETSPQIACRLRHSRRELSCPFEPQHGMMALCVNRPRPQVSSFAIGGTLNFAGGSSYTESPSRRHVDDVMAWP